MDIVQAAIKENPWIAVSCFVVLVCLPSVAKIISSLLKYIVGLILARKAIKAGYGEIKIADIELSRSTKKQEKGESEGSYSKIINFPDGITKRKDKRQK